MVYNGITFIIINQMENFKQMWWDVEDNKFEPYVGVSEDIWKKEKDKIIDWATKNHNERQLLINSVPNAR